ncbi:MAG TPA: RidA family protein [Ramlibacter sp.]|nr:RidA family protein [Ramlibacter sp.]
MSHQAILPSGWPRPKGYANGIVATGRMLFIAGMIGWDANEQFPGDDFAAQARQALQNIADVLREAGGKSEDIVRMTWYVTDKREYLAAAKDIGRAFREIIGHFDIAMTAVEVKALIEDRAKVEIEVTAVLPE